MLFPEDKEDQTQSGTRHQNVEDATKQNMENEIMHQQFGSFLQAT